MPSTFKKASRIFMAIKLTSININQHQSTSSVSFHAVFSLIIYHFAVTFWTESWETLLTRF